MAMTSIRIIDFSAAILRHAMLLSARVLPRVGHAGGTRVPDASGPGPSAL
eukprot:COSAG02_NODE_35351_length_469_cov_1.943243_1_plen_49_part_10